jgi:hypothetical protein
VPAIRRAITSAAGGQVHREVRDRRRRVVHDHYLWGL